MLDRWQLCEKLPKVLQIQLARTPDSRGPLRPERKVMVTGSGKPVLTLPRDAERLARYERRFRELQEKFRKERTG